MRAASGTTAQRPVLAAADVGTLFFDSSLGYMLTWSGTAWLDGNGNPAGNNPGVAFAVTASTALALATTAAIVQWTTVDLASAGGNVTHAAGRFTVAAEGLYEVAYQVTGAASAATASEIQAELTVGAANLTGWSTGALTRNVTGSRATCSAKGYARLAAGAIVDVRALRVGGTSALVQAGCRFSIRYVEP
jgi:hypothetical protein